MTIISCLTPARKIVFGIFLLICVNFLWVLSSEVSHYIYVNESYNKPFFTTYLKTALFSVYLLGFLFSDPWRVQCKRDSSSGGSYFALQTSDDRVAPGDDSDDDTYDPHPLGDPCFEPIRIQCTPPSSLSGGSSCSSGDTTPLQGHVKFSSLVEVRSLSDSEDSRIARMSYTQGVLYKRHQSSFSTQLGQPPHAHKLSLTETMRVALTFSVLWFLGSWAYAEALCLTQPSVVNIISATSGIFVCILAALFPSNIHDNFTFSKFAAAFISVVGVVLITMAPGSHSDHNSNNSSTPSNVPHQNQLILSDSTKHHKSSLADLQGFWGSGGDSSDDESVGTITSSQLGVLWALMGAFGYAVYLVTLKHQVGSEENIDIPMFFGFVGLFTAFVMGPGLYVFHILNWEQFELPDLPTFGYIVVNGLLGTVLSEFLWLWGCFLTSSLAGTLSLSMTTPMTMLADVLFRGQKFSWHLYVGSVPIVFSFFAVTTLQQYNNWDPIGDILFRAVTTSRTARASPPSPSPSSPQGGPNVKGRKAGRGTTKLKRAAKVLKKPVDATSDLFNTCISKTNPTNSKLKVEDDDDRDALLPEDTVVLPASPSESLQSLSSQ